MHTKTNAQFSGSLLLKKIGAGCSLAVLLMVMGFSQVPFFASAAQVEVDTGVNSNDIEIEVGSDGLARFAYFKGTTLYFAKCDSLACTSPSIVSIDTANGPDIDMVLGADNIARIAYRNPNNGFKFALCNDLNCSSPTITTPETNYQDGLNMVMVLGSDTYPRIVHADPFGSNLKFVQCLDASCSTTSKSSLNLAPLDGFAPKLGLAMDPGDNLPRIVYSDSWAGAVIYMQCTNANCSTNTTETLTGVAQGVPSLQMTSGGLPKIMINDGSGGDITLITCTNASCSSKSTSTIVSGQAYTTSFSHSSYRLTSTDIPLFVYKNNSDVVNYIICADVSCSSADTYQLFTDSYTPVMALTSANAPRFAYGSNFDLFYDYCDNVSCSPPFTAEPAAATLDLGATGVEYTFTLEPLAMIPDGGKIEVVFPSTYSASFAVLTDADVTVTGDNIVSTVETFDDGTNTMISTLNAPSGQSEEVIITIDDDPGLTNPSTAGSYPIAINTYDDQDELLDEAVVFLNFGDNVNVSAVISEALIFTIGNSAVALQVDPSVNGGRDASQYTGMTVATNALNGYSIYGRLDDGLGNAQLSNGNGNNIASGTSENNFGFEATNADYDNGRVVSADASLADASTVLNSNAVDIGLDEPTNNQDHTVYYVLDVDYTTPAGAYTGTLYYTALGSW